MNSKHKGNIGEAAVLSSLIGAGFSVLLPFGDNEPYDLVVEKDGIFKRIQCKHRKALNGVINISKHSINRSNGKIMTTYTKSNIDVFAIYCPDNNSVYYLNIEEVSGVNHQFSIRIAESLYERSDLRYAFNYKDPNRIFDANIKSINNDTSDLIKISESERARFKASITNPNKIKWPDRKTLEEMIWSKPVRDLSRDLGVSDIAIHKRCKKLGIVKPPRGYWLRK